MKQISLDWLKHLEGDRKKDFEVVLRNNVQLFTQLRKIINDWEADILKAERSKSQYETPRWTELQAHRNGNLETIQKLKDLISFIP